ncbi:MAG: hypothetical protein C4321_00325 [Chloroflexota bacterium]
MADQPRDRERLTHSISSKAIATFCASYGYTSERLAKDIGVSQSAVSRYLHGKRRPSAEVVERLCSVMIAHGFDPRCKP